MAIQQLMLAGRDRDPHFANVVLLAHMNGANDSTTFVDSSASGKSIVANGAAKISTAQSKFSGSSGLFDGSSSYLSIGSSSDFAFGAGDFTIEAYVRISVIPAAGDGYAVFTNAPSSSFPATFFIADDGRLKVWNNALVPPSGFGGAVPLNAWTHIAFSRAGGTLRAFVAGSQQWNTTHTASYASTSDAIVGKNPGASSGYFNGYIAELRVTKGVGRYVANFTPPNASFPDF